MTSESPGSPTEPGVDAGGGSASSASPWTRSDQGAAPATNEEAPAATGADAEVPAGAGAEVPAAAGTAAQDSVEAPPATDTAAQPSGAAPGSAGTPPQVGWTPPASTSGSSVAPRRRGLGGAFFFGLFLVFVGVFFLVRQIAPDVPADQVWPWLSIAFGAILVVASLFTGR